MIGCLMPKLLSFPLQGVNGWYQLLDELRGRNENVQVPLSISKYEGASNLGFQCWGQRTFAVSWKCKKIEGINLSPCSSSSHSVGHHGTE